MALKKPKILYEKGTVQKMAKALGVSQGTIRNALRFVTEGDQPDKIREEALKYYGCVMIEKPIK